MPLSYSPLACLALINSILLHCSQSDLLKIQSGYVISLLRTLCWLYVTLRRMSPICHVAFKVLPDPLICLPFHLHLSPLPSSFFSLGALAIFQSSECMELSPTLCYSYILLFLSRVLYPHDILHFSFLPLSTVCAYIVICVIIFRCLFPPQKLKFHESQAYVSLAHQIMKWQA